MAISYCGECHIVELKPISYHSNGKTLGKIQWVVFVRALMLGDVTNRGDPSLGARLAPVYTVLCPVFKLICLSSDNEWIAACALQGLSRQDRFNRHPPLDVLQNYSSWRQIVVNRAHALGLHQRNATIQASFLIFVLVSPISSVYPVCREELFLLCSVCL